MATTVIGIIVAKQNIWGRGNLVIHVADECMGVSRLLVAHARAVSPKSMPITAVV